MEEKVFEMEYIINGEKYLITATKVADETIDPKCQNDCVEAQFTGTEEESEIEDYDLITVPMDSIPDGMDLNTWLSVVKEYGIILTK